MNKNLLILTIATAWMGGCSSSTTGAVVTFEDGSVFETSKGLTDQEAKANPKLAHDVAVFCSTMGNNNYSKVDKDTCERLDRYTMHFYPANPGK